MSEIKKISLNGITYSIVENYKDCLEIDDLQSLFTEYFYDYDYILGDYSYNKLRLKGFYREDSKNVKEINNIKNFRKYIEEYCAYNCSYFLIKKEITIEKKK